MRAFPPFPADTSDMPSNSGSGNAEGVAGVRAKLCGLSRPDHVETALKAGADWLGFVIFPRSPRHVAPETLADLTRPAAGQAARVAVLVNADDDLIRMVAGAVDVLQLHGNELPKRAAAIRARTGLEVWKSLPVAEAMDVERAKAYAGSVDRFLFDAKPPPDATMPGGNGVAFNAALLADADVPHPWLLSGGLDAESVGPAVTASGARAVDVSSGIETAPGVKSAHKMLAFMAATRTLECHQE